MEFLGTFPIICVQSQLVNISQDDHWLTGLIPTAPQPKLISAFRVEDFLTMPIPELRSILDTTEEVFQKIKESPYAKVQDFCLSLLKGMQTVSKYITERMEVVLMM